MTYKILLNSAGSGVEQLLFFGLIFAIMYFFMIRPQIKKQKKENQYRLSLKKGDSVITIGGIHGKIIDIKKHVFIIEVHGGSKLKIAKNAVSMNGDSDIQKK